MIGVDGQPLFKTPPTGFYLAGHCPVCEEPVFYHGGGEGRIQGNLAIPAQAVNIEMHLYRLCDCDTDDFEVRLPREYDLLQERGSLDLLFEYLNALCVNYRALQESHRDAVEQIKELMDERNGNLQEEAGRGEGRAGDTGESGRTLALGVETPEVTDGDLHHDG